MKLERDLVCPVCHEFNTVICEWKEAYDAIKVICNKCKTTLFVVHNESCDEEGNECCWDSLEIGD